MKEELKKLEQMNNYEDLLKQSQEIDELVKKVIKDSL